ncbi:heterokaryon incompatibility protein-domain-containing protein, partial [Xylaria flabelliformis]
SYCNRFAEQELPTRVIDVGTKDTAPKLLESRGRRAKYVTLSHCWGNGEYTPLRTTEASLSGHYNEIPWTKLGQTFQDAILITRELGIQFIWIDSLCIIQDSPSDWETESARMAEIYLHSHLTLSATASTDGRGGCLCSRERDDDVERENYDAALSTGEKLQHIPVNLTKTDIFVRKAAQHAHGIMRQVCENSQESAPLLSRAWVYQETVLSPRTVHFHGEELVWECREALRCECGYYESIDHRQVLLPFGWKHPYTKILFKEKFGQLDVFWVLEQWDSIVWTYSGLRLTYDSDRLHALAGLASFFAEKLEDSYVAGLWYKDLCNGLLWQRDRSVKCRRLLEPGLTMPTWSWASI